MNKKIKSDLLSLLTIVLSAIGGYSLVKYGIIGLIPFVAGMLVLVLKWKYVDNVIEEEKIKERLQQTIALSIEEKCNHEKCIRKKEDNSEFCDECIQLPSKICNQCVTKEMVEKKYPELVKDKK
jgi:hypothetical protein